jgi:hypothetical protein
MTDPNRAATERLIERSRLGVNYCRRQLSLLDPEESPVLHATYSATLEEHERVLQLVEREAELLTCVERLATVLRGAIHPGLRRPDDSLSEADALLAKHGSART